VLLDDDDERALPLELCETDGRVLAELTAAGLLEREGAAERIVDEPLELRDGVAEVY